MEHEAVVNSIFSNIKQVDLLVVEDLKGYKKARKQQEKIMSQVATNSSKIQDVSLHRIHLLQSYKGIGLHLNYDGVINHIETSSPADLGGLHKGQRIVEVNGINVRGKSNREIAAIIKENINDLVIGVENEKPTRENVIDGLVDESKMQKDSTIKKLIESNVINPVIKNPTPQPSPAPQKIRPVDENIFMQTKAVSENAINIIESPNMSGIKTTTTTGNIFKRLKL
jgi:hypothetical protein